MYCVKNYERFLVRRSDMKLSLFVCLFLVDGIQLSKFSTAYEVMAGGARDLSKLYVTSGFALRQLQTSVYFGVISRVREMH